MPVSLRGTASAEYDKNTWSPLEELARDHPEAGVHFQGWLLLVRTLCFLTNVIDCEILSRKKDLGSATADWFAELLSPTPWFKDVVPNVCEKLMDRTMR